MTDVYTRDGRLVQMSPEEADQAWRAGQVGFAPGATQTVQTRKGEVQELGGNELAVALSGGGRLLSGEELQHRADVAAYDNIGGEILTATASAANNLTFGGLDYAGSKLIEGYAEERRNMIEANPTADIVGAVGGELLGVALTGGGSALLKAGVKGGAKALGKTLLREGAEEIAEQSAKRVIARKALEEAGAGAIEAALFETGRTISQMSINEQDITAEELLAHAGEAALYGGVFGGVFGATAGAIGETGKALGKGAAKLRGKLAKTFPELGEATPRKMLEARVDRMAVESASLGEMSEAAADVAKMKRSPTDVSRLENGAIALREGDSLRVRQARELGQQTDKVAAIEAQLMAKATPETAQRQVAGIVKDLEGVPVEPIRARALDLVEDVKFKWGLQNGTRAELKKELANRTRALKAAQRAKQPDNAKLRVLQEEVDVLQGKLDETLDITSRTPLNEAEKGHIVKFQQEVDNLDKEFSKLAKKEVWSTEDAARYYQMMDKFKQNLNPFVSQRSRVSPVVQARARDMYESLRVELTDPRMWGNARALRAGRHNELITRFYDKRGGLSALQQRGEKRLAGLGRETGFDPKQRISGEVDFGFEPGDVDQWVMTSRVDSGKLDSFSKKLGTQANNTAERDILDHISAIEANNEAAFLRGSISDKTYKANAAELQAWRNQWKKNLQRVVDADSYSRAWGMQKETFGLNAAALEKKAGIGMAEGYGLVSSLLSGNVLGAAVSGASIAASALPKYFDDFQRTAAGMSLLDRSRRATQSRVSSAAKAIVTGKRVKAARRVGVSQAAQALTPDEEFERNVTLVQQYRAEPEAAIESAVRQMGPMASATPKTAAAFRQKLMRQLDMMNEQMPGGPPSTPYLKGRKPDWRRYSRNDVRKFNDFCRGLGNPMQVISNVEAGTVSKDELDGFRQGYPNLYNELRMQIEQELTNQTDLLPRSVETNIARLFGFALTPSWEPAKIAALQDIARGESGAPQRSDTAVAPSAASPPDMAESFATRTGQILGNVRG